MVAWGHAAQVANTVQSETGPTSMSKYHSPLRARQAAQTRQLIIDAAIGLFARQGWAATTLPMVASEAGTSVDTIYATFGSKSALFMAAIDVAIVGDDEEAAMVDRPEFAVLGKGRRSERLRAGVAFTLDVYERSVPILKVLREAAASDAAASARLARYDEDRRGVMIAGLGLILGREPPDSLVDALWTLISPEVYSLLIEGRGWSRSEAEVWLTQMATAAIGVALH